MSVITDPPLPARPHSGCAPPCNRWESEACPSSIPTGAEAGDAVFPAAALPPLAVAMAASSLCLSTGVSPAAPTSSLVRRARSAALDAPSFETTTAAAGRLMSAFFKASSKHWLQPSSPQDPGACVWPFAFGAACRRGEADHMSHASGAGMKLHSTRASIRVFPEIMKRPFAETLVSTRWQVEPQLSHTTPSRNCGMQLTAEADGPQPIFLVYESRSR